MKIKLERSGEDLMLPLPDELIKRYQLKEGDWIDGGLLIAEFAKRLDRPSTEDSPDEA